MKVAISYPPLPKAKGHPTLGQNRQFQYFSHPSFIYPLVPAWAATLLQANGFDVIWNDALAEGWSYAQFLHFFSTEKPDLMAIETKTPVIKQHWEIITTLKEINPATQIVLMGDHVTALPGESLENSLVDYVLTGGDYDFSLLSLARHLRDGEAPPRGLWYREGEAIKNSGPFVLNRDLDSLPLIDRDLTRWTLYGEHLFKKRPATYTMAGRDCPYGRCTFCAWTTLYPRFRVRHPASLLTEIEFLIERYGVKEIFDDTGTFPAGGWLKTFCQGMIEQGYNRQIKFSVNMRMGVLSQAQYDLMGQAGFRVLKFGLESASQDTLNRLRKGTTVPQIIESCKMAKQAGLEVHLTTMVGYPWESREDAQRTLDLAREMLTAGYADMLQATLVIPYPGTVLFAEAQENDWLRFADWERYDMSKPVLRSPIPDPELLALVRGLYRSFLTPQFIWRKALSIRSPADIGFFWRAGLAVLGHLRDFGRLYR